MTTFKPDFHQAKFFARSGFVLFKFNRNGYKMKWKQLWLTACKTKEKSVPRGSFHLMKSGLKRVNTSREPRKGLCRFMTRASVLQCCEPIRTPVKLSSPFVWSQKFISSVFIFEARKCYPVYKASQKSDTVEITLQLLNACSSTSRGENSFITIKLK